VLIPFTAVPYRVSLVALHAAEQFDLPCKFLAFNCFDPIIVNLCGKRQRQLDAVSCGNGFCSTGWWLRELDLFARRSGAMILTNKLLPVALIAALIGGSVGALVMHKSQPAAAETVAQNNAATDTSTTQPTNAEMVPAEFNTAGEQTAYKTGFADGYNAAMQGDTRTRATSGGTRRVVYRNASSARRVYYDYNRSSGRSFWSKHRDKLTMAIGTGAGAAIGGLIGGKKGAGIGALSGLGGSALYTYKLRNRTRRY
jgi:hypothetical protein